jgi:hypothetical protein
LQKYDLDDVSENINGVKVPSMMEMLGSIDYLQLIGPNPTGFHGDFILDNILVSDNFKFQFMLIDWRQDFNGVIESGDMYYDLAKLNHNLVLNHSILHDKHFKVDFKNGEIFCDVLVKKTLLDFKIMLKDFCDWNGIDYAKIEILTSLIWINMSPLHEHPLDTFLYYFGKYNLFLNLITK